MKDCECVSVFDEGSEDRQCNQPSACLLRGRVAEVIACVGSPCVNGRLEQKCRIAVQRVFARGYKATVTISEYSYLHVEVCGPSTLNLAGESTS